jgi:TonB family protein
MTSDISSNNTKDRIYSAAITLAVAALFFLFLILYRIVTPIPPFPESSPEGMEIAYGFDLVGFGNTENNQSGDETTVNKNLSNAMPQLSNTETTPLTEDDGEPIKIEEPKKIEKPVKETNPNTSPTKETKPTEEKPKENKALNNLLDKFKNKKEGSNNTSGGGSGTDEGQSGNQGDPDGNPDSQGKGGSGNNPNSPGTGKSQFGFNLQGRNIIKPPLLVKDSQEEGKVVVDITVDKEGNVLSVSIGRGTSTTSSVLRAKAKQAVKQMKFNNSAQFEEQKGSVTIVFSF